jgi:hypothetical protein
MKAGFEIIAFLVILVIGLLFGALCGLAINFFLYYKEKDQSVNISSKKMEIVDEHFFDNLMDEIHPLYCDALMEEKK